MAGKLQPIPPAPPVVYTQTRDIAGTITFDPIRTALQGLFKRDVQ